MLQILDNHIRFGFFEKKLCIRVIGQNEDVGVPEALDKIEKLEQWAKVQALSPQVMQRKWFWRKRTDCIILELEKAKIITDRRKSQSRKNQRRKESQ